MRLQRWRNRALPVVLAAGLVLDPAILRSARVEAARALAFLVTRAGLRPATRSPEGLVEPPSERIPAPAAPGTASRVLAVLEGKNAWLVLGGARNGVRRGQLALDGSRVCGLVESVSEHLAVVAVPRSTRFSLGARIEGADPVDAIVRGTGESVSLDLLPRPTTFNRGLAILARLCDGASDRLEIGSTGAGQDGQGVVTEDTVPSTIVIAGSSGDALPDDAFDAVPVRPLSVRDASDRRGSVWIDRGSAEGLTAGSLAGHSGAVLGRIVEVAPHGALVGLAEDPLFTMRAGIAGVASESMVTLRGRGRGRPLSVHGTLPRGDVLLLTRPGPEPAPSGLLVASRVAADPPASARAALDDVPPGLVVHRFRYEVERQRLVKRLRP